MIFSIYSLTKLKPIRRGIHEDLIENSLYHGIESNETIVNFENRHRRIYPMLTLELKNKFPTLPEIFNSIYYLI